MEPYCVNRASPVKPCATCRRRRVKCDRVAPACSQCTRSGWTCPGYQTRWQFRNTKEKPEGTSKARQIASNHTLHSPRRDVDGIQLLRLASRPLLSSIASPVDSLRADFVAKLNDATLAACFRALPVYPYLRYIPQRIGVSPALDNAVRCVCQANSRPAGKTNLEASSQVQISYIRALRDLQYAINDCNAALAPETLASALLLQMYELRNNTESPEWACHATGAIRLIEFRGPELFKDDLELALLEAEIGNIYLYCMQHTEGCFLSEAVWAPVFSRLEANNVGKEGRKTRLELMGLRIIMELPGIIADYIRWQHIERVESNSRTLDSMTCHLFNRTTGMRQRLFQWRKIVQASVFGDTTHRLDVEAGTPPTKVHKFAGSSPRSFEWALMCSGATCTVLVNHILLQLHSAADWLHVTCMPNAALAPLCAPMDRKSLVDQSSESVEIVNLAYTLFKLYHPTGAKLFGASMIMTWSKATFWSTNCTAPMDDSILRAVGSQWPADAQ